MSHPPSPPPPLVSDEAGNKPEAVLPSTEVQPAPQASDIKHQRLSQTKLATRLLNGLPWVILGILFLVVLWPKLQRNENQPDAHVRVRQFYLK